jgi:hypothetical protein
VSMDCTTFAARRSLIRNRRPTSIAAFQLTARRFRRPFEERAICCIASLRISACMRPSSEQAVEDADTAARDRPARLERRGKSQALPCAYSAPSSPARARSPISSSPECSRKAADRQVTALACPTGMSPNAPSSARCALGELPIEHCSAARRCVSVGPRARGD